MCVTLDGILDVGDVGVVRYGVTGRCGAAQGGVSLREGFLLFFRDGVRAAGEGCRCTSSNAARREPVEQRRLLSKLLLIVQ